MFTAAAWKLGRFFGLSEPETKRNQPERPGSTTQTLRALTDLGESIASGVHAIYSPVRLYLCVAMEPKKEALAAQKERDRHEAAGLFEVDELWSAAAVNARWARRAALVDEDGAPVYGAVRGARGMTDAGAKEVFFEFNAMEAYPEKMYLSAGESRIRVR